MKKRILYSACALAVCFAACTNDDFQTEQSKTVINEAEEVIGADLVSSGMKMNITNGTADTRLNDNGWENGDKVGLAWYQFSSTAIANPQEYSAWLAANGSGAKNELYANHIFTYQPNGQWETQSDVYQGAYFCYWPFDRMPQSTKLKTIEVNGAVQTEEFENEYLKNAFHISAQDFIMQGMVDEDMTLQRSFYLAPMVNSLGVTVTPDTKINASNYLKSMKIKQMQINTGISTAKVFIPSGVLQPKYLPKTKNADGTDRTEAEIKSDLYDLAGNATGKTRALLTNLGEAQNYIRTTINGFDLNAVHTLRAFAFPLQEGVQYAERQYPNIAITVYSTKTDDKGDWQLGTFNIKNGENEKNDILTTRLKSMLEADETNAAATWVQHLWGTPGSYEYARLDAELTPNNFTPYTSGIRSVTQWNDLVQLINELDEAGKSNFSTYTDAENKTHEYVIFSLGADVTFTSTEEFTTPDNVEIVLNTGSRSLKIGGTGEVEWPDNLITNYDKRYITNIVVNEGATLNVGIERNEEVNLIASSIKNEGTIKAGAKASISTESSDTDFGCKLDNSKGMVIVEFGAYVYPAQDKQGIIAYEMTNSEPTTIGEINTLKTLENGTQRGYAQINTLILSNNVELDLNAMARAAGEGDRYEDGSDAEYLQSLADIDIIMRGASIICKKILNADEITVMSKVNNIKVEKGTNTITDVRPQGNITVEKGSTLTIASLPQPPFGDGTAFSLNETATIKNDGTLNVNETVTTYIFDNAVGTVNVENGEKLLYTYQYIQGGTANGTVEKVEPVVPEDPAATAAENVKSTFKTYATAISATTLQQVVDDLNSKGSDLFKHLPDSQSPWSSAAFYMALHNWLVASGSTGLSQSGTPSTITVQMLELFQSKYGNLFE